MRKQRWLALLVCAAMVIMMLPATAWAADGVSYLDASGNLQTCATATEVTASDTDVTWNAGWYVVQGNVTINNVTVTGDVHLILADNCSLTSKTIEVRASDNASLTIYAQSVPAVDENGNVTGNTGRLTADGTGNNNAAGIGGGSNGSGGTITINGGTVTAIGGKYGAGIGGGWKGSGGTIKISGGTVTATGGEDSAGIGGGREGSGGTITINGGNVTAKGGTDGAGIGGGWFSNRGNITINGGNVTAKGGTDGAGIGGGSYGSGGTITITGGTVTVTGKHGGAGIGGGREGSGGDIAIRGGNVTAKGGSSGAGIGSGWQGSGGTIKISGGTVTATGYNEAAGIGIGSGGSDGTFSTTASGNPVIFASSISDQSGKTGGTWNGVIFEGSDGKVYGASVTPSEDFTIESGKRLLIPTGSTLTISDITAVNNGSVYVDGTLSGLGGNLYYPLTVIGGTAGGDTATYLDTLYGKATGTVTLTGTNVPVGQAVSGWTASDSAVTVENSAFTMPSKVLTVSVSGHVNAPTYTVTIPATVELGGTATVTAEGVNVVSGSSLVVTLTDAQGFKLTTDEGAELSYGITKDSTSLSVGSTVLAVAGGTANASGSAELTFSDPTTAIQYSGEYKGTVTFTITIEEGSGR